jgi:glycyl-tRNA synthetase
MAAVSLSALRRVARKARPTGNSRGCRVACSVATLDAPKNDQGEDFKYKIDLAGIVSLCKQRGFIFQSGEIYGGYSGFFDYGPLGVELKNNLKKCWWQRLVYGRDNIVGLDSSIISTPSVHKASGHVENFSDPMVDCTKSKKRFRADQLMWAKVELEDGTFLGCVSAVEDGDTLEMLKKAAKKLLKASGKEGDLKPLEMKDMEQATEDEVPLVPSPATGEPGTLTPPRSFNLMFETQVGPYADSGSISYLRPETAQGIFVNFKNVEKTMRARVPFGIAQIGKAFRNEITPRQFIFRSREFEQMEVEYFIDPEADFAAEQEEWLKEMWSFLLGVGLDERLMEREVHEGDKLAHYARACTDIIFEYPFGPSELLGVAARGSYDLTQHAEASKQSMEHQVPGQKLKYTPHVIEPSLGVDRLFLALLCSAYDEDEIGGEKRSLLRFKPCVAPIKCAVFPLMKKPPELAEKAKAIAAKLRRRGLNVVYDEAGSIGKRYRRMDEVGTPFCVTVDFDTLEDGTVTLRDRDDPLDVKRIHMDEISGILDKACEVPMGEEKDSV